METKRLILRKWKESDIDQLTSGLNDPDIANRFGTKYPYTKEDARAYIHDALLHNKEKYAIVLKNNNRIIGGCGLHFKNGNVSESMWISTAYQNKGYGTEASIALVQYCFSKYDVLQLNSTIFETNIASQRMQEKIGGIIELSINTKGAKKTVRSVLTRENFIKAVGEKYCDTE